mmetsp:Transcript_82864/g.224513  ORF Transcript_82864/g.224513 Transcript_82864/m.224513 type:complete len:221 (+) Transcript_82864:184-846(+)
MEQLVTPSRGLVRHHGCCLCHQASVFVRSDADYWAGLGRHEVRARVFIHVQGPRPRFPVLLHSLAVGVPGLLPAPVRDLEQGAGASTRCRASGEHAPVSVDPGRAAQHGGLPPGREQVTVQEDPRHDHPGVVLVTAAHGGAAARSRRGARGRPAPGPHRLQVALSVVCLRRQYPDHIRGRVHRGAVSVGSAQRHKEASVRRAGQPGRGRRGCRQPKRGRH